MPLEAAIAEIETLLGTRLSRTQAERDLHSRSETYFGPTLPDAVAWPETTEEISAIVSICATFGVPIVAWGAGTSLEGHALTTHGGICLNMSRMNRVLEVSPEDMLAVVQPGLTREELNTELRATGLFFSVDPGANASLGGMAGTRASGTTTVRYGSMRDNVAALEVVLADGRIIRTGSRAAKSAAGYDLTALMLGSEGTLGIITELTLRLHGQPEAISSAVCAFDTLETAVETVQMTIQMGIPMARIEFVDEEIARVFNKMNGTAMPEKPHLLIEFHGSHDGVAEDSKRFGEVVAEMGGADFQWATSTEERNRLWKMRHGAYTACLASRPGCMGLVTDVCVPISRLAEAVAAARADIEAEGLIGPILGHVGDGNFHAILLLDRENADELARAKRVAQKLAERSLAMGGTITGEHGVGLGKRGLMTAEHGEGWQVMGAIKAALDPLNILNPGKVVPDLPLPESAK
ncbi:FAD-binding oxidoreductase [Sedimentimonas flavescens]|uniref:FAD-binding oxidoreductase n=1 Tax=Sedimentimonas flavescens TaxID=2851012 RepID=UPI001C49D7B3|nr:FAD-linked oxidase C-terminal domain-containing protein [Sedimentimonas flavescens]MBW0158786.1 FAD-binding protein [Sedimentimonas flavescens]